MAEQAPPRTVPQFFQGRPKARALFALVRALAEAEDGVSVRVTKSQIAFSRRVGFAWAWTPDRYLGGSTVPLVLSVALRRRDSSPRWKEVVQPARGRWMHHLELREPSDVDEQVRVWLHEAASLAE